MGGRNALIYTASSILSRAVVLVLAPLYTRTLEPSEYGDLAIAQTFVATAPTFVSLGMLSAVSRFYFDGTDKTAGLKRASSVARWIAVLALGTALLAQMLLAVLPLPTRGLLSAHDLTCIVWGATGSLLLSVPVTILRASQRAMLASALQFFDFLASLASALVLVLFLKRGFAGALESVGVAGALTSVVGLVWIWRTVPGDLDRSLLSKALFFSLPYVPHFAANQLLMLSDRWVLKAFGLEAELGLYSLASQLAAPAMLVVTSWNEAASPRLGEQFRQNGKVGLRDTEKHVVRSYALVATCTSLALLAGSPLVTVVFGPKYSQALWLLPAFCVLIVIESFYFPYANILFFMNKTKVVPRVTIFAGLVNVAANFALVPLLGISGALISRAIGGALRSLTSAIAARRTLRE